MTTETMTPPTLTVTLGHDTAPDLTADARTLAAAYLTHALATPPRDAPGICPIAPSSRTMRARYLPGWSRTRYAAAVRSLTAQHHHAVTERPDGTRHLHVTVPAEQPPRLLCSNPRTITRDLVRLRLWTEPDGTPDHRELLGDLDGLGSFQPGQRLVIDLGEATYVHQFVVHAIRDAVAAGRIPRPELESRSPAVLAAWRRAIDRQG